MIVSQTRLAKLCHKYSVLSVPALGVFLVIFLSVCKFVALCRSELTMKEGVLLYPCHNLAHKFELLTFCELSRIMHCVPVTIFHVFYAITHFSLSLAFLVLTSTLA